VYCQLIAIKISEHTYHFAGYIPRRQPDIVSLPRQLHISLLW